MVFSTNQKRNLENYQLVARYPKYFEILDKWKVLPTSSFLELCDQHKVTVYKTLRELETLNVISRISLPASNKPNQKLVFYSKEYASIRKIHYNEREFHHDFVTNLFLLAMKRSPLFHDLQLEHEIAKDADTRFTKKGDIEPDALIYFNKELGGIYEIAIETEIIRKNNSKVLSKFHKYANSDDFRNIIYYFITKEVYEAYKCIFKSIECPETREKLDSKMILVFNPDYLNLTEKLNESVVFKKGEEEKFNTALKGLNYGN